MSDTEAFVERGTPAFRRISLALFCAGFATFALLYCVQPLLPVFTEDFGISPANASLAMSLPTAMLAFSLIVSSALSEALGRTRLMVISAFASAVLGLASAFATSWEMFLALRMLQGVALSGLPASTMAYLAEEVHPRSIGLSVGLTISGNALGGMTGRVLVGIAADHFDWQVALAVMGVTGLIAATVFWRSLPPSRHFRPRPLAFRPLLGNLAMHLAEPGLRGLFLVGFILMGSFVTVYNYIGFLLLGPPFGLSHTIVGAIFAVYVVGVGSSTFIGWLADRVGRPRLLWIMMTLLLAGLGLTLLPMVLPTTLGLAVFTFGFFGAHSIANAWVGRRALQAKAQASSLYQFGAYTGAGIVGTLGGLCWPLGGWTAVVALVGALVLAALALSIWLSRLKPIAPPVG
jgi:YNFM family putative membrane transporter